jgi:hypothetical protein
VAAGFLSFRLSFDFTFLSAGGTLGAAWSTEVFVSGALLAGGSVRSGALGGKFFFVFSGFVVGAAVVAGSFAAGLSAFGASVVAGFSAFGLFAGASFLVGACDVSGVGS